MSKEYEAEFVDDGEYPADPDKSKPGEESSVTIEDVKEIVDLVLTKGPALLKEFNKLLGR